MTRKEHHNTFTVWMRDHRGILHKVTRAFAAQPAVRDELRQEILIAVWRSIPGYRDGSKVSSYIYRVALNRAISWVRRERAYQRKLTTFEQEARHHLTPTSEDPRLELIYTEIRRLNKSDRALILLQLEGFNYDEIAQALGLSLSNVGVRLTRIRHKLAANLKDK